MSILVINLVECPAEINQGFQRRKIFNQSNTGNDLISLEYVVLSKGSESSPHEHVGTHTVVFTLQGSVRIYFGLTLENQVEVKPAGCVYIPPGIIHYVVNEHDEDMIAIVARSPSEHLIKEYINLSVYL